MVVSRAPDAHKKYAAWGGLLSSRGMYVMDARQVPRCGGQSYGIIFMPIFRLILIFNSL